MKRLKILWKIIRVTGFSKLVLSFILYLFFSALLLNWLEPSIRSFGDGLWYAFVSATTLGYGDIVVTTFFGRVLSVILTIYGLIFFGCLSGVLVNYGSFTVELKYFRSMSWYKAIFLSNFFNFILVLSTYFMVK